jgi:hypothetical protein
LLLRCVLRGEFIKNGNKAILHNRAPDGTNSQSIRQRKSPRAHQNARITHLCRANRNVV